MPPQLADTAPLPMLMLSPRCYHRSPSAPQEAALHTPELHNTDVFSRQIRDQVCDMRTEVPSELLAPRHADIYSVAFGVLAG